MSDTKKFIEQLVRQALCNLKAMKVLEHLHGDNFCYLDDMRAQQIVKDTLKKLPNGEYTGRQDWEYNYAVFEDQTISIDIWKLIQDFDKWNEDTKFAAYQDCWIQSANDTARLKFFDDLGFLDQLRELLVRTDAIIERIPFNEALLHSVPWIDEDGEIHYPPGYLEQLAENRARRLASKAASPAQPPTPEDMELTMAQIIARIQEKHSTRATPKRTVSGWIRDKVDPIRIGARNTGYYLWSEVKPVLMARDDIEVFDQEIDRGAPGESSEKKYLTGGTGDT